jgi:hypothetical protein
MGSNDASCNAEAVAICLSVFQLLISSSVILSKRDYQSSIEITNHGLRGI